MIPIDGSVKIFVATRPIDFRAGINRLMDLVTHVLGHEACTGDVFVFRNKSADKIRLVRHGSQGSGPWAVSLAACPGRNDRAERSAMCRAVAWSGLDEIASYRGAKTADLWLISGLFARISRALVLYRSMSSSAIDLPRDPEKLAALVRALQAENEQLRALLKGVAQQAFGTRSERSSVLFGDQGLLDLQDFGRPVASDAASPANDDEASAGSVVVPTARAQRERALRVHLERIETVIEPASLECSCCQGTLHRIGEDASEALDWVPAIVRVIRTIRPRYGCRKCHEGVTQAPMPARVVPDSMVTTSTLAWMATARFAWSIPLNRQLQMLAGQGVVLDRSTPSRWMRKLSWWLRPLYQMLLAYIHSQPLIFCDETRMPIQEKGRRRVKNTQFWAHACDDRPWRDPARPAVVYIHACGRGHAEAREQLGSYTGTIQVDGYAAYQALARSAPTRERISLAFCLAHARRKFVDAWRKSPSPLAERIIAAIGEVYTVEARIKGLTAEERQQVRQLESGAPMARIKAEIDEMLPHLSPKSNLAKAMRYTLAHWQGLNRFIEDGRLEVDTNTVERGMKSIAQGRKSSLFAGSDGGAQTWAILASLLQTARLNGLDPYTWLNDVLTRIVTGQVKNNELGCLLAWNRSSCEPTKVKC